MAQADDPAVQCDPGSRGRHRRGANTEIAAATDGTALPNCVVRPEVTEGPYYVDENLVRSDIRTDPTTGTAKEGTPFT